MDWIERAGSPLRFDFRAGREPTLVLTHEMGGTLESWDEVLPLLPPDLAVLRYDTRGAGLSGKIRGTARLADFEADLAALIEATGRTGPLVLCGIAVGAAVAFGFAARHPDRVAALIAHAPAVGVPPAARPGRLAQAATIESDGMAAIAAEALARSYPEALRADLDRFARFRARWLGNDPGSYAAILRMLIGLDLAGDLAAIRCPTLVLAGTQDLVRPPDGVRDTASLIPGARFATIPSGHFAAIQTPDLLAAQIRAGVAACRP